MEQLVLIFHESPILTLIKNIEADYTLIDIHGECIGKEYTLNDIYTFINSELTVFDSQCNALNYSMFSNIMKPSLKEISNFLTKK